MNGDSGSLETVAILLRAAEQDAGLRQKLRFILNLPAFQRASLIHTAAEEMTLRREPRDVVAAFRLLVKEEAAETALRFLAEYDGPAQG